MTEPLVTCICPTIDGRADHLLNAVRCFLGQTYSNCELLIVFDGEGDKELPELSDGRVRYFDAARRGSIGAKRNYCCSLAEGELIAHFDDDDWSSPFRLADQVGTLQATKADVTAYHSVKFTNGDRWWQYAGGTDIGVGLSLCYRRSWWAAHPFDETLAIGEDSMFLAIAARARKLRLVEASNLIFGSIHPGNTSKRHMESPTWKPLAMAPADAPEGWLKAA